MAEPREPSHPPSDPYPSPGARRAPGKATRFAEDAQPTRTQLVAAALVGLGLVATGMFLWRRARVPSEADAGEAPGPSAMALGPAEGPREASLDAGRPQEPVMLSDARTVACHDRGSKTTLPDDCDRLVGLEQAFSRAIEQAASCVPDSLSSASATIEYVADVSFTRHMLRISLPRAARSVHDRKVVAACAAAVRGALPASALDSMAHEHSRYRISITATYRRQG